MTPRCSVIIVSRHRPAALLRCIAALRQQDHDNFNVIVVADPAAVATLPADVCAIPFDEANISAARNLGLARAAGIVAFIDDDAVAEPFWLSRLTAPFADPKVTAATGFVRGRNGLSWQWRAVAVDHLGQDHPLEVTGLTLRAAGPLVVKTQGTNCAFRAGALRDIGGFDPAFRFYLDEADVNLRLGGVTAIVPDAVVHHGYMASARRNADRVPLTLFDIAASTAVFLRHHAPDDVNPDALILAQSVRLQRLRRAGKISAARAAALMETLHQGWADGLTRPFGTAPMMAQDGEFHPLGGIGPRPHRVLVGRIWQRRGLIRQALAARGEVVTIICLSPSVKPHWFSFDPAGYWLQTGGIWGRADRSGPRLIWGGFARRVAVETARLLALRPAVNPKVELPPR